MSESADSVQCVSCGAANSSDAQFCQKCGKPIAINTNKCKRCGSENSLEATFCKICGVKLSEARLGITKVIADEWWVFLTGFDFYNQMWADKGIGPKIHEKSLSLCRAQHPDIDWETTAFAIPITASDWCIKLLEWDQRRITYGEVVGTTTGLIIFDLSGNAAWEISYEEIETVDFNRWIMFIQLFNGSNIKFHIKEASTAFAKFSIAAQFLSAFANQSAGDREASYQSTRRVVDDAKDTLSKGENFWQSIVDFFDEVFSHE